MHRSSVKAQNQRNIAAGNSSGDAMQRNAGWDERCRKEQKHQRLVESYQLNIRWLQGEMFADKPNRVMLPTELSMTERNRVCMMAETLTLV